MAGTVFEEKAPSVPTKKIESVEERETEVTVTSSQQAAEVQVVKCDCCQLTEECTIAYIAAVREMHQGRWICGLCAEAVQDEMDRSALRITEEEALERHASFCEETRSPPEKRSLELISAVKQLLIRSLESPRTVRSNPGSPRGKDGSDLTRVFGRSQSCFPSMDA